MEAAAIATTTVVVTTAAGTTIAGIAEVVWSTGSSAGSVTSANGSPVRYALRIQTVAAAAWLFRVREDRSQASSLRRRRLNELTSDIKEAKTLDASSYSSLTFLNCVEALPWYQGKDRNPTSNAREMLMRCLGWFALILALAELARLALWFYLTVRRVRKRRMEQQQSNERDTSDIPIELKKDDSATKTPDVMMFPRVEMLVLVFCFVPCTLACVTYGTEVLEDAISAKTDGVLAAVFAATLALCVLVVSGMNAYRAMISNPYLLYQEDQDGIGHWISGRPTHPNYVARFGTMFTALRGQVADDDDDEMEYSWRVKMIPLYVPLQMLCIFAAALCCAYGGAVQSRRAPCAVAAGCFMTFDAGIVCVLWPMRSRLANAGAVLVDVGCSVGFFLLAAYFHTGTSTFSTGAVATHLASLFVVGVLVEMKLSVDDFRGRIKAIVKKSTKPGEKKKVPEGDKHIASPAPAAEYERFDVHVNVVGDKIMTHFISTNPVKQFDASHVAVVDNGLEEGAPELLFNDEEGEREGHQLVRKAFAPDTPGTLKREHHALRASFVSPHPLSRTLSRFGRPLE